MTVIVTGMIIVAAFGMFIARAIGRCRLCGRWYAAQRANQHAANGTRRYDQKEHDTDRNSDKERAAAGLRLQRR
jgi:hypothetical protein